MGFFSVTERGNYEEMNTLRINRPVAQEDDPVPDDIKLMKMTLWERRELRRAPDIDRKIITAWNGLALMALSKASKTFGRGDLLEAAKMRVVHTVHAAH
jgi:uncharacterized protein YyaL (SSP411 family)